MPSIYPRTLASLGRIKPVKLVVLGYLSYVVAGWVLLSVPWCWAAGQRVRPIDNLFTATSAVSTTGLATVSTPGAYSYLGEIVILLLIQVGGLGYMTLGSFVVLAGRRKLTRLRAGVAESAFVLPEGFDVKRFISYVVIFTLAIEAAGAAALYPAMRHAGVPDAAWHSIFHSVSAFCTAGFSTFPNSLESFGSNVWINLIIGVLSVLGAIGFIVMSDLYFSLTGQRRRVTLTTRIILATTGWVLVIGWVMLFFADPGIAALGPEDRLMASGFQAMSAMTTVGFNTYPVGQVATAPALLLTLLMIIGASPSGTGGGLKSTSLSAVIATMRCVLLGKEEVTFFGKTIPRYRLHAAFAALGFYSASLFLGAFLLMAVEDHLFEDVFFEAASALGTVGLSRGLTSELTPLGKLIVVALMFVGRVGPLTFGMALFAGGEGDCPPGQQDTTEDLAV